MGDSGDIFLTALATKSTTGKSNFIPNVVQLLDWGWEDDNCPCLCRRLSFAKELILIIESVLVVTEVLRRNLRSAFSHVEPIRAATALAGFWMGDVRGRERGRQEGREGGRELAILRLLPIRRRELSNSLWSPNWNQNSTKDIANTALRWMTFC